MYQIRRVAEIICDKYDAPITIDEKSKIWAETGTDGKIFIKLLAVDGYVYAFAETYNKDIADGILYEINTEIADLAQMRKGRLTPASEATAADEYDVKDYVDDYSTSASYGEEWYD